jgi:hypothetical protein
MVWGHSMKKGVTQLKVWSSCPKFMSIVVLCFFFTILLCVRPFMSDLCKTITLNREMVQHAKDIGFDFFFLRTQYNADAHKNARTNTLWTRTHTPYLYEHLRRTETTYLEVDEVTTGASLLTDTSPTTESIAPLNPDKCKHQCQVFKRPNHQSHALFAHRAWFWCRIGWKSSPNLVTWLIRKGKSSTVPFFFMMSPLLRALFLTEVANGDPQYFLIFILFML